jgi:hypothetical protein
VPERGIHSGRQLQAIAEQVGDSDAEQDTKSDPDKDADADSDPDKDPDAESNSNPKSDAVSDKEPHTDGDGEQSIHCESLVLRHDRIEVFDGVRLLAISFCIGLIPGIVFDEEDDDFKFE